ncbi:MAG: hypothetical protein KAT93_01270 [Desulfuromonadales bacterium]|jgi:hypothetical protein|nr:hypothetical protein [Desulfuromonadales bacterium]
MNEHLIFGLFALYVVAISLYGILSGSSDARLALVRKVWGRVHGLSLYFCVHVILPLLVGIMFIGWGTVNFSIPGSSGAEKKLSGVVLKLDWHAIQKMKDAAGKDFKPEIYLPIPLCA